MSKVNLRFVAVLVAVLLLVTYVPAIPLALVNVFYHRSGEPLCQPQGCPPTPMAIRPPAREPLRAQRPARLM